LIVAIAISLVQAHEEKGFNVGKVDKWDTVKDIPAHFAATSNPIHQPNNSMVPAAVVVTNGGSSGHNSIAPAGPTKEEIFEQLRDFYGKYDKEKNLADVEDVAGWAVVNGIAALNAKLMSKYKADLNTLSHQSTSTGVGTKALQEDLDI